LFRHFFEVHREDDEEFVTHPFFDIQSDYEKEKGEINYFLTTPEGSSYKYNLNLLSGRLYKERSYCLQDDIWEHLSGELEKPNFAQAIVPQTFDQNGVPQKILIFGDSRFTKQFKYHPLNYDTAKIIGSVILESCESYPCDSKKRWKQSQILIGRNIHDRTLSKVISLNELRSFTNWTYALAVLVNQDGAHKLGKNYYPAFRITKELNLDDTNKYFDKNAVKVNMDELTKWQSGCFALYDQLWEQSEKIRTEKMDQQAKFLKLFKEFYKTKSDQYFSCQKLVRAANINQDPRRQWFFSFIDAFTNLEKNNLFFSCSNSTWSYNPKVDDDHNYNDQNKELERCHAKEFEKSFDQAINGLSILKNQTNKTFRFSEYDSGRGGSHQKLYTWIAEDGHSLACKNKNVKIKENQFDLFPQDVVWEGFSPETDKTIK
jgi:hypothetical protein